MSTSRITAFNGHFEKKKLKWKAWGDSITTSQNHPSGQQSIWKKKMYILFLPRWTIRWIYKLDKDNRIFFLKILHSFFMRTRKTRVGKFKMTTKACPMRYHFFFNRLYLKCLDFCLTKYHPSRTWLLCTHPIILVFFFNVESDKFEIIWTDFFCYAT